MDTGVKKYDHVAIMIMQASHLNDQTQTFGVEFYFSWVSRIGYTGDVFLRCVARFEPNISYSFTISFVIIWFIVVIVFKPFFLAVFCPVG